MSRDQVLCACCYKSGGCDAAQVAGGHGGRNRRQVKFRDFRTWATVEIMIGERADEVQADTLAIEPSGKMEGRSP
jgi:hypothetical protein